LQISTRLKEIIYPTAVEAGIKSIPLGFTCEQMLSLFSITNIQIIVVMLAPLELPYNS
jgi:hypothetical protein